MKCQNMFSGKNNKKYFKMSSAEIFTQSTKRLFLQLSHKTFRIPASRKCVAYNELPNKHNACPWMMFIYARHWHFTANLFMVITGFNKP